MSLNKNIKNLKELQDMEFPVDLVSTWGAIESGLSAGKKKRKFLWWMSAASLLLLCSISYFLLNPNVNSPKNEQVLKRIDNSKNDIAANKTKQERKPDVSVVKPQEIHAHSPAQKHYIAAHKFGVSPNTGNKNKAASVENNLPIQFERLGLTSKIPNFIFEIANVEWNYLTVDKWYQDMQIPDHKEIGWDIYLTTTPTIVNKMIKASDVLGWKINKDFSKITDQSEYSSAGFYINLGTQMNIGKKWFIQTGLGYSEKMESVNYRHTLKEFTIVRESEKKLDYAPLSPQQWVDVKYQGNNSYKFAEVPLLIGVKLNAGEKLEWRSRAGLSYWRLVGKSGSKLDPTSLLLNDLTTLKNYRNNSLGFMIYSGLYYNLNPSWSIMAEPGASISITNLTVNSPVETRPYQYGLNIGVQYKLK